MTSPVTGPYTRTTSLKGPANQYGFRPDWFYRYSSWYRQRKPYTLNLAYILRENVVLHSSDTWTNSRSTSSCPAEEPARYANAINKAYAKLVEAIGESSLWAVNVAEHRQSEMMVFGSALRLTRFVRKLARFDYPGAAAELRTFVPKGLKPKAKAFGDNFLAFHFGWEPLVKDIGAAIDVIQAPLPIKRIKGRASVRDQKSVNVLGASRNYNTYRYVSKVSMQADLRVTNPNLFLASQLGFINPAAVAWELVPFSFVVDWFVNVGQCLSSFTDFAGCSILNPATTKLQQIDYTERWQTLYYPPGSPTPEWLETLNSSFRSVYMTRTQSITGPVLKPRPWKGVSMTRAATAIALLVQKLR